MELVVLVSTGKGSWAEASSLIEGGEWEKILLVGEEYARKFSPRKQSEFIQVNFNQTVEKIKKELLSKLKNKLRGPEIALNISSGSGKEHIALISALLCIPVGIKFVAMAENGIIEL